MAGAGNNGFAANPLIPAGAVPVNKFGRNPDISTTTDPEDVWGGGDLYVFMPSAISIEVLSSDAVDDKDAGTGARTIELSLLDPTGIETFVTVELEGLTPVVVPGTFTAINRVKVITVGAGEVNAGLITIRGAAAGPTYAVVEIGEGQTTQAIYTVPSNKKGKIVRHWATFDRSISAVATMHCMVKMQGESWQNKQAFTISNNAPWDFTYNIGGIDIEPWTRIRMEVVEVSANGVAVDAGFDLYLVDV